MKRNLGTNANPNWLVRAAVRNGKEIISRKRTGIPNEVQADKIYAELLAECYAIKNGLIDRKKRGYSWVAKEYLLHIERDGTSENTVHRYRVQLEAFSIPEWGTKEIASITRPDVIALLDRHHVERQWNNDTRVKNRTIIKNVFDYAISELGILRHNPAERDRDGVSRTPRGKSRKTVMWSKDEVRTFLALLDEAKHPFRYLWKWSIYTGCRNGESYATRWRNIDFTRKTVTIGESWSSKTSFKATKTNEIRTIALCPPCIAMLKELKVASGGKPNDFVLPRNKKWDRGDQARQLKLFLIGTGLPTITHHDLRAVWCSSALREKVPWHLVKMQGGWRDFDTISSYARAAGVDIEGSLDVLDFESPETSKVIDFKRKHDST